MRAPDELDIRLMRELVSPGSFRWDVREPYGEMARRLGIDEETLRKRMRRAEKAGILQGMHLIPNPHLIGHESAALELDVDDEDRKPSVLSQLRLLEGAVFIVNFLGKRMRPVFYYDGQGALTRKVELIKSICGSESGLLLKDRFPACNLKLSDTDWRIIKTFRKDARRSLPEVAKQVHVSTRTVKRRVAKMTDGNAFFLMPALAHERSASTVSSFTVLYPPGVRKEENDAKIRSRLERLVFSNTAGADFSIFSAIYDNVSQADEDRHWIGAMKEVKQVTLNVVKEFIIVPDWLDDVIGSMAREAA